jgi:DNA-binding winged helix-turn-helix (wHTH) protein
MGTILDFRFGNFEIDAARQELRRAGEAVHIEPQVFDLLVHLVQNRDRIVSKDELIETIWRGRIISEAALSSCISAARTPLTAIICGQRSTTAKWPTSLHFRMTSPIA